MAKKSVNRLSSWYSVKERLSTPIKNCGYWRSSLIEELSIDGSPKFFSIPICFLDLSKDVLFLCGPQLFGHPGTKCACKVPSFYSVIFSGLSISSISLCHDRQDIFVQVFWSPNSNSDNPQWAV